MREDCKDLIAELDQILNNVNSMNKAPTPQKPRVSQTLVKNKSSNLMNTYNYPTVSYKLANATAMRGTSSATHDEQRLSKSVQDQDSPCKAQNIFLRPRRRFRAI